MEAVYPVLVTALKSTINLPSFGPIFTIMNNTIILISTHQELTKILYDILTNIEPILINYVIQINDFAKLGTEHGEKLLAAVPEMVNKINTMTSWAEMCIEINERCKKHNLQACAYFVGSPSIAQILSNGLQIVVNVGTQQPESMLSGTGNTLLDDAFNSMKAKFIELGNIIHTFICTSPTYNQKMASLPLQAYCLSICPKAIMTLAVICVKEYDKLESRILGDSPQKIVVGLLRLLSDLTEDNNFYQMFNQNKHSIISDIVLILLRTTTKELKSMKTDPQNFVNLAIDTCDMQDSEVPKTEAAKLLENLCDHIDGCLTFISIFCCEAIKYGLSGANPETLNNYPMLAQFNGKSIFLVKSTPELIVETTILVMADISYSITKRKDLFGAFEHTLIENFTQLFGNSSILIKCRLASMLGMYLDSLFINQPDLFAKCIEFTLQGMAMEKEEKAFSLQCAETLKTAMEDDSLMPRMEPFANKLFPLLCSMTETMELVSFYEILMTMISWYSNSIDESLIKLIEALVRRVEKEYKELRAKGEHNNMTINQCWNVIRAICEQKAFFPMYMDKIENAILPMFNYLVDPTNIEFDDDMVQVITTLIGRRGGISENMGKIFPYLVNFFEKYGKTFGSLLQTLNAYLYYGKDIFVNNKAWIELIINLSVQSMFTTKENIALNNTEGAILAQMLLQSIGNSALDAYIPVIIEQIVKRLNSPPQAEYLKRELDNAILCAVCNNAQLTLQKIEALKVTEPLFSGIIEHANKYKAMYDIKVLVVGFSTLLIQKELPPYLNAVQAKILNTIVTTLQNQAGKDNKHLLKEDKKQLGLDVGESKEEESSSSSEEENEMKDEDEENEYFI